jgi:hypothetical protein
MGADPNSTPDSAPVPMMIPAPPPPARSTSSSAGKRHLAFTPVDLPWLRLKLPGEWFRSANPNSFEYTHPLGDEQLIVMVVPLAEPLTLEQQRVALASLFETRRHAAVQLSGGLAELSAPEHRASAGQHEVRLFGINHKDSIQFAFLARSSPRALVNLSLYRYNVNPLQEEFAETARGIFDRLEIKI